ncbi:MAG: VOC family protein [Candidatus Rokuibacteriota bacterium]
MVKMPVTDMFWDDRVGQLTDPFGHLWTVATHTEDLGDDESRRRGQEFFKASTGA